MRPKRIQMSRQRPWRAENPDAVIVARPSAWGNPYRVERVGKTTWHVTNGSWLCETIHSRSGAEARSAAVRRLLQLIEQWRDSVVHASRRLISAAEEVQG